MRRHPADHPVVITSVPESADDEYDRRRRKYAVMMTLRALCVVGAALTYRFSIILALVFVVGGAILPWCAVLIANDRPPKKARQRPHVAPIGRERALPAGEPARREGGPVVDG